MNKIILQLILLGFCIAIGQALQCYDCKLGFWGVCLTSETKCEAGEQCSSGIGVTAGVVDIQDKGCLKEAECNQTTQKNFPEGSDFKVYSMNRTCCTTDLCNGATGLPGASRLSLGLAAVTTLLMAQVLV